VVPVVVGVVGAIVTVVAVGSTVVVTAVGGAAGTVVEDAAASPDVPAPQAASNPAAAMIHGTSFIDRWYGAVSRSGRCTSIQHPSVGEHPLRQWMCGFRCVGSCTVSMHGVGFLGPPVDEPRGWGLIVSSRCRAGLAGSRSPLNLNPRGHTRLQAPSSSVLPGGRTGESSSQEGEKPRGTSNNSSPHPPGSSLTLLARPPSKGGQKNTTPCIENMQVWTLRNPYGY
ncbi:hypothetical protein MNBD_ACTINO01-1481, partial [hydrothermal vent metagenome]